jgi:hypothetical protein
VKVEVVEDPTDTEEKKTPAKRSKNSKKKQSKVRITVVHEAFTKHLLQSPLTPVDPLSQALSLENAKLKKEVIKLKADVTELKRQSKDLSKSHKGELDELNERLAAAIQENKALLREAGAASVITAQKTKKVPAQPPTAPATQVATTQSLSPLKALVPVMMMMAQARLIREVVVAIASAIDAARAEADLEAVVVLVVAIEATVAAAAVAEAKTKNQRKIAWTLIKSKLLACRPYVSMYCLHI